LGIQIQRVGVSGPILLCSWFGRTLGRYLFTHPEASQIRSALADGRHGRSNGNAPYLPRGAGRNHIGPHGAARGRSVHAPRNDCTRRKSLLSHAAEFRSR
jgi:hypothetical protein